MPRQDLAAVDDFPDSPSIRFGGHGHALVGEGVGVHTLGDHATVQGGERDRKRRFRQPVARKECAAVELGRLQAVGEALQRR